MVSRKIPKLFRTPIKDIVLYGLYIDKGLVLLISKFRRQQKNEIQCFIHRFNSSLPLLYSYSTIISKVRQKKRQKRNLKSPPRFLKALLIKTIKQFPRSLYFMLKD